MDARAALRGASAERVVLMGHSAGAHLCAMALMHRQGALATTETDSAAVEFGSTLGRPNEKGRRRRRVGTRQPRAFVAVRRVRHRHALQIRGLAGGRARVYDGARDGRATGFDRRVAAAGARRPERWRTIKMIKPRRVKAPSEATGDARGDAGAGDRHALSDDDDDDARRADDSNGVVTDVAFDTLRDSKNDFMRRTDWAPMGIMDTDENISVGEIVARARSALAPASEKENAREKETTRARRDTRRRNGSRRA